ncbi:MAG: tetratricopeptide repeat protein, partial [Woeseia sp.]
LALDPDSLGARNNLAMTLLAQGRHAEALAEIDIALQDAADSPLRIDLLNTRETIVGASLPEQH